MSTRMKVVIAVAVLWIAVAMIHATSKSEPCIVTATGHKLCGDDARAWCSATDTLRAIDTGSVADQMAAERSQEACNTIRGY